MHNKPKTTCILIPMENKLNCGANLVMMAKAIFVSINIMTKVRDNLIAPENITPA
jgi:hypothetical protein